MSIRPGQLAAALGLVLLLMAGCMDNHSDNGVDVLMPSITLLSPKTGDTLVWGEREIRYDVPDPHGVKWYELYVNDSLRNTYPTGASGDKPAIIWKVDSSMARSRVRYCLKAYDIDGNAVTSPVMSNILVLPPATAPLAPKALSLWKLSPTTVNLVWEDVSDNETSFEIWRKSGTAAYSAVRTLPMNSTSVNDSGSLDGVVTRYKVRAVNDYGYAESNEVSTGSDAVTLNPPTNLSGTPLGTRQVALQWTDNSTGELGFVIQRKVSSGSVFSQVGMVGPNVTTFVDTTGLTGGSSFTYRVAARGQFGLSGWSNDEAVLTLYQDIYPPSSLLASLMSTPRRIKLTWRDNSVLENETRVERRTNPAGGYVEIGKTGTDTSMYVDTTVQFGLTYTYRVRAHTADDHFSAYSNETTITVQQPVGSNAGPPGTGATQQAPAAVTPNDRDRGMPSTRSQREVP